MTDRNTIRSHVEKLLDEGIRLEYVWHHIQAAFPHNSASWSYIKQIERKWVRRSLPSQQIRS